MICACGLEKIEIWPDSLCILPSEMYMQLRGEDVFSARPSAAFSLAVFLK